MEWLTLSGHLFAIAGTLVMTLSVIGIVRSHDARVKINATSTIAMLGLPLVLAATLFTGEVDILSRALVVGLSAAVAAPLVTHALARLALSPRGRTAAPGKQRSSTAARRPTSG